MNNTTPNLPVVRIGNTEIPLIAYRGKAALTTELLATLYGTEEKNIQNNYLRNPDRFEIGKHFFKLEGEELTLFKMVSPNLVAKNAKHLMLWTERGAARHAKLVETDQAWDVFEKLEDAYFDTKPESEAKEPRAKMEAKLLKFLEGKPLGVSTTAISCDCFLKKATPLPLDEVLEGLVAAGVLAMEEIPRVDGNPGRPTRLWRLSHLTLASLPDPASKLEQCKVFIAQLVELGPVDAAEAMAACEKAGFSVRTIARARHALALPTYQKSEGGWVWQKPEGEGKAWVTLTLHDLDARVRSAARGMGLSPRKATLTAAPVAFNSPPDAAGLPLQRMLVETGFDGRLSAQMLRDDEIVCSLDALYDGYDKRLEREGFAIVAKSVLDAAKALLSAMESSHEHA